jgi:hypothetical protein
LGEQVCELGLGIDVFVPIKVSIRAAGRRGAICGFFAKAGAAIGGKEAKRGL